MTQSITQTARAAVSAVTLGCRLNAFESEAMKAKAFGAGLTDTIIVNTCAVTAEAVRQARQSIRRARRDNPTARIVVTGCAAQTEPETFRAMPEVAHLLGNADKLRDAAWAELAAETGQGRLHRPFGEIMAAPAPSHARRPMIEGLEGRTRAFVQVQNGCDHRCTFCIIPFGRGPSRSVPIEAVVAQVARLADNGYGEVVLTGVDITSYGDDLPGNPRLGQVVQAILRHVPGLARLRLSSIDSVEVDDALHDALASERRLMPHLHLSLQAGADLTLKRMKRRHLTRDALRFCERARRARPDLILGADMIVGFPTETEAMFEATRQHVSECGLTFLHVFPFSPRPGTPAARMPPVAQAAIKARAATLRADGAAALHGTLDRLVGTAQRVLVERDGMGRTEGFVSVLLCEDHAPGTIIEIVPEGHDGTRLLEALVSPSRKLEAVGA